MLEQLLKGALAQDYADKEIIVSDDSKDDAILECCTRYIQFDHSLRWIRNRRPGKASINMNNAINHAQGEIIKPMFGDDYFVASDTLTKIIEAMGDCHWAFVTSTHSNDRADHVPYPHRNERELALGENTYGCPSAAIWKRSELRFDERLIWLMDCEFYARMYREYGAPALLPDVKIGICEWEGQQTNTAASGQVRLDENVTVGAMYD